MIKPKKNKRRKSILNRLKIKQEENNLHYFKKGFVKANIASIFALPK